MNLKKIVFAVSAAMTHHVYHGLALVVDKIDALPEAQRALYVEKDGKYRLDVEGVEDVSGLKSALEKERGNNKAAKAALAELQTKYEGVDPELFRAVMSKFESAEEAELLKKGNMDEIVTRRTVNMKTSYEKKLAEAVSNVEKATKIAEKYKLAVVDNHIRAAASKAGVHEKAVDDALIRGRMLFTLDDSGNPVQVDESGSTVFGADGKTPFSPAEWMESMKAAAPHWFPAGNTGGGAGGSKSGGAGGGVVKTRAWFDTLDPVAKSKFVKDGGKLVDA